MWPWASPLPFPSLSFLTCRKALVIVKGYGSNRVQGTLVIQQTLVECLPGAWAGARTAGMRDSALPSRNCPVGDRQVMLLPGKAHPGSSTLASREDGGAAPSTSTHLLSPPQPARPAQHPPPRLHSPGHHVSSSSGPWALQSQVTTRAGPGHEPCFCWPQSVSLGQVTCLGLGFHTCKMG